MWFAKRCCRPSVSHARKWDPCPLSGQWLHLEDLVALVCHRREKIPMMETWKVLFLLLTFTLEAAVLFNHLEYSEFVRIGTCVPIFLKVVFDVLLGIREGLLDPRLPHNLPGKGNTTASNDLPRITSGTCPTIPAHWHVSSE